MLRIDSLESRVLFASIAGVVWNDLDNSKTIDPGETLRRSVTVYIDENADGTLDSGEPTTITNSKGRYSFTGLSAGTYTIGTVLDTDAEPALRQSYPGIMGTAASRFNIDLRFRSTMSAAAHNAFVSAIQKWETVIRGDIADVITAGGTIDDLQANIDVQSIDGVGGTLAYSLTSDFRDDTNPNPYLAYQSYQRFDADDLASLLIDGDIYSTILHEMGHTLGFNSEVWAELQLIDTFGGLSMGFDYRGPHAVEQLNLLNGGGNDTSIQLETGGGGGTAGSHWSDDTYRNELMTGYINSQNLMPLSTMTIGSMEDIGYEVDYTAADTIDFNTPSEAENGDPGFTVFGASINETPGDNVAYAHNVIVEDDTSVVKDKNFGVYTNHAPTIRSLSYSVPGVITAGTKVEVSARSVTEVDGDPINSVTFYRETNGTDGLQVGVGGDTLVERVYTPTNRVFATTVDTTGFDPGNQVIYARARDKWGKSSTRTSIMTIAGPATKPLNFTAGFVRTATHKGVIRLTWQDVSGGIDSFRIERSEDPGFSSGVTRYTVPPGTESLDTGDITAGSSYYYRIRAYNAYGASRWSGRVSVQIVEL